MTIQEMLSAISDAYETCQQYCGCVGCPKTEICYEKFDRLNLSRVIYGLALKCDEINNSEEG